MYKSCYLIDLRTHYYNIHAQLGTWARSCMPDSRITMSNCKFSILKFNTRFSTFVAALVSYACIPGIQNGAAFAVVATPQTTNTISHTRDIPNG